MTEDQIRTTAKLLDARDAMRRLHGETWPDRVKAIAPIVNHLSKRDGTSPMGAAIKLAKSANEAGESHMAVVFLAVGCELSANVPHQLPPPSA